MIIAVIVACEIGFWALLGAGLVLRYPARKPRAGAVVLASVPVVDLVLLVATVIDLRSGTTADVKHGLAAAYIGFSIAYGHSMVRWADARFAHRFAGGPRPQGPPKYGMARAVHEWRILGRTALAAAVAIVLLQGAVWLVDVPSRTAALTEWQGKMLLVTGINLVVAASYTLWPKSAPDAPDAPDEHRVASRPGPEVPERAFGAPRTGREPGPEPGRETDLGRDAELRRETDPGGDAELGKDAEPRKDTDVRVRRP